MVKAGKIRIIITRSPSDSDPVSTAQKLLSSVFLRNDEHFCPLLPEYWQLYCAGDDPQVQKRTWMEIMSKHGLNPINSEPKGASGLARPKSVSTPDPSYTKEAAEHHVEGRTTLRLVIDETGHANAVTILKPLGVGLDEEALKTVSQWQFRPATQNGKPVQVEINVEMNFRCCPMGY
jgi:TonB family protein